MNVCKYCLNTDSTCLCWLKGFTPQKPQKEKKMSQKAKTLNKVPHKYDLKINTPLLYLLHKTTGHSTYQIINHFYNIMLRQRAEIEGRLIENKNVNPYSYSQQKKSYGYYPGTEAYCIISTTMTENKQNSKGQWMNSVQSYKWSCNVSLIRGSTDFDHEGLEKLMAEGILIGDAAGPAIDPPHLKKVGRKDDLSALKEETDPNKDV